MNATVQMIEMFAGLGPDGKPVAEKVAVKPLTDKTFEVLTSPAFVKGLASGDTIGFDEKSGEFDIKRRSGNLCLRVISRHDMASVCDKITSKLEKLGGSLDIETPRMCVYSIHVSCGFKAIEAILDEACDDDSQWSYGNVYSPEDGQTPLNWWHDILKPE